MQELREAAADRVPVPLRTPWRAAAAALVLAALLGTAMLARSQGSTDEVGPAEGTRPTRSVSAFVTAPVGSPSPSGTVAPGGSPIVVHVIGRVRRPGLVRLKAGSRVWDAVTAAGGAASGARLDRLNLARPLADGEQITVPGATDPVPVAAPAAAQNGAAGAGAGAGASGAQVDLNTATEADLDALPGVGPVLAGRVLAWRAQHGRFTRVEELGEVTGIGDKLLAQLTPLVRV